MHGTKLHSFRTKVAEPVQPAAHAGSEPVQPAAHAGSVPRSSQASPPPGLQPGLETPPPNGTWIVSDSPNLDYEPLPVGHTVEDRERRNHQIEQNLIAISENDKGWARPDFLNFSSNLRRIVEPGTLLQFLRDRPDMFQVSMTQASSSKEPAPTLQLQSYRSRQLTTVLQQPAARGPVRPKAGPPVYSDSPFGQLAVLSGGSNAMARSSCVDAALCSSSCRRCLPEWFDVGWACPRMMNNDERRTVPHSAS
jgi:hypothetical protein